MGLFEKERFEKMGKRLYVGNLPYAVNDERLLEIFSEVGTVSSAQVILDRNTGRSKGFGFVEMATEEDARLAIEKLNQQEVDGRNIVVNEARPNTGTRFRSGFRSRGFRSYR